MMNMREIPLAHPGEILLEDWLKPMNISQYALAKAIDVPPRRINDASCSSSTRNPCDFTNAQRRSTWSADAVPANHPTALLIWHSP